MEPARETEEELKELLDMTRENNEILHGMRRRERIGNIFKIVYVSFIILSFYGAYVFAEPYIKQFKDILNNAQKTQTGISSAVKDVGGAVGLNPAIQNFLNEFLISTSTKK